MGRTGRRESFEKETQIATCLFGGGALKLISGGLEFMSWPDCLG
jgi:hypothetical protein